MLICMLYITKFFLPNCVLSSMANPFAFYILDQQGPNLDVFSLPWYHFPVDRCLFQPFKWRDKQGSVIRLIINIKTVNLYRLLTWPLSPCKAHTPLAWAFVGRVVLARTASAIWEKRWFPAYFCHALQFSLAPLTPSQRSRDTSWSTKFIHLFRTKRH